MDNIFEVNIAGILLKVRTEHNQETVNALAHYVDKKIREALPLTKNGSIQNAALLASLHIAEDLIQVKKKARTELNRLEYKTRQVISELESSRNQRMGSSTNEKEI